MQRPKLHTRYSSTKEKLLAMSEIDPETGCRNWIGGLRDTNPKKSYGVVYIKNKTMAAHRVSYEVFKGEKPGELLVCHKCDNPRCINPDHLFLGTALDNHNDCYNKGRHKGNGTKLTYNEAALIKNFWVGRLPSRWIRKMYGINRVSIFKIVRGKSWKQIPSY